MVTYEWMEAAVQERQREAVELRRQQQARELKKQGVSPRSGLFLRPGLSVMARRFRTASVL